MSAKVEVVAICHCTNEELERGVSCGRPECPNLPEARQAELEAYAREKMDHAEQAGAN